MNLRLSLIAAFASAALPSAAHAGTGLHPECDNILPSTQWPNGNRALMPEDLVRLRDIGPVEPQYFPAPIFTISPDGRHIAFQLRRADPEANRYCLAMVIFDLFGKAQPKIVDEGGDPLILAIDLRGIEIPNGVLEVVTPRWSSDGRWIAFLKRSDGTTQVWRAFADGSGSAQLTHSIIDVVDFRIGPDGSSIVYATRPQIEREQRAIEQEGLNGSHYDDRFAPWIAKRPLPRTSNERQVQVLDVANGITRAPNSDERALVAIDHQFSFTDPVSASDLKNINISATNPSGGARIGSFHARRQNGIWVTCNAPACDGAVHPWWTPAKNHVRFLRRDGWANASSAIYDWDVSNGRVRRLYITDDILSSCTPQNGSIICLIDASLEPGRLVKLDPATGSRQTLFDPNPEFAHLTLGKAVRLHWRNAFGIETISDLVLPVGYRPGEKYPMVVVQYDSRGFLRGGTDDEYPIQAFANRGYAVLSFKRPAFAGELKGGATDDQVDRLDLEQFADRRNVFSSLEGGVRLAIERGIADPKHIGITGLSDGSSTLEWALIHSSLFSAAATSSCCWSPTFVSLIGPSAARHFLGEGWPNVLEHDAPFWKQVSLEANARRITTPILVNAADFELLNAVEAYTGLREAGVPIDMFVYPGEYHGRWQPAHRLATYRRSLDWFDYWLRDIRSNAPDRQSELKEWDRLKKEAGHGRPI